MEADLTTTDVNPPRRMTARTGDAMLAADAPSRAAFAGQAVLREDSLVIWPGWRTFAGPACGMALWYASNIAQVQVHVGFETGTPTPPGRPAGVSGQGWTSRARHPNSAVVVF
jgi:hypothetical protein